MVDYRRELKSRYSSLSRLYEDLRGTAFARMDWDAEVLARRTLGSDDRIEHWFLAEHFLVTWSNWRGLLDRFCRYFGQPVESFPKTWSQLIVKCEVLVFQLAQERELDGIIAFSWVNPDQRTFPPDSGERYDIAAIYSRLAKCHEHAELLLRAEAVSSRLAEKEETSKRL